MEKLQGKKPLIRFPEFKDSWEHKKLSELLSESKKRNEDLKFGKDEVLSVSGEYGIVNQIEHLGRSYAGVSVHQYHIVETGDIVYTKSPLKFNPYGIIKLNKGKAGIVSTLYAVYNVQEKNAYGTFLDYYFSLDANTNRYLRPLVKKGAKNDMKINNAYVLHDRIFAPTTAEQKRIASFLTVLDKKISELKQKKNLLEQYKKGVMQKIFSQELRFKDDKGKGFPKWEKKKLGDVSEKINSGKTPFGGERVYTQTGILFLRSQNIIDNKLSFENSIYIPEKINNTMNNSVVKPKDILLNITGASLGRSCVVPEDFATGNVNQHVCIIRINQANDPYFIQPIFASEIGQKLFNTLQTGSGREGLNFGSIRKIVLSFPSLKEQNKIANFFKAIDEKINHCQMQIEKTEQYKKGLLQKMFC
jgi:type I restriction enzyme, S subunit